MTRRTFKPPLDKRFARQVEDCIVYTVDAFAMRNASETDEEFDNVATHHDYPDVIPAGEIWTAASTWKSEGPFFIANAVAELKARQAGESANDAYEAGVRAERLLREQATGIKFRNGRPHRRVPAKIYNKLYCELPDEQFPVQVWLVDGRVVRCFYKTDYTEGGHGYVYPWCPRKEIWIERSIAAAERPYILAHEYTELRLMRDAELPYERAHAICSEMEFDLRKARTRARFPGLSWGSLSKPQLPLLTRPEFFEFVQKNYQRGCAGGRGR